MPDEVYTDCPACGEEIPFYETVDEEPRQCPECGAPKEELFEIGIASSAAAETTDDIGIDVAADGGLE